jgi:hypothetical protein
MGPRLNGDLSLTRQLVGIVAVPRDFDSDLRRRADRLETGPELLRNVFSNVAGVDW